MKKFKFRLDVVLKMKKSQEDMYALALTQAEMTRRRLHGQIEDLENQRGVYAEQLSVRQREVIAVQAVQPLLTYLEALRERVETKRREQQTIQSEVELLRRKLEEAAQERKVLENLKERLSQTHQRKAQKNERKQLDSVVPWIHPYEDSTPA